MMVVYKSHSMGHWTYTLRALSYHGRERCVEEAHQVGTGVPKVVVVPSLPLWKSDVVISTSSLKNLSFISNKPITLCKIHVWPRQGSKLQK